MGAYRIRGSFKLVLSQGFLVKRITSRIMLAKISS